MTEMKTFISNSIVIGGEVIVNTKLHPSGCNFVAGFIIESCP